MADLRTWGPQTHCGRILRDRLFETLSLAGEGKDAEIRFSSDVRTTKSGSALLLPRVSLSGKGYVPDTLGKNRRSSLSASAREHHGQLPPPGLLSPVSPELQAWLGCELEVNTRRGLEFIKSHPMKAGRPVQRQVHGALLTEGWYLKPEIPWQKCHRLSPSLHFIRSKVGSSGLEENLPLKSCSLT